MRSDNIIHISRRPDVIKKIMTQVSRPNLNRISRLSVNFRNVIKMKRDLIFQFLFVVEESMKKEHGGNKNGFD